MTDEEIINECHREIRRLRAVVRDLEDELKKVDYVKGVLKGIKEDIGCSDYTGSEIIERLNVCLEMLGEAE